MLKRLLLALVVATLAGTAYATTFNAVTAVVPGGATYTWGVLAVSGDIGDTQPVNNRTLASVQVDGGFGTGGTVVLEGSNDGTTWATLVNNAGTSISCAAACFHGVRDQPRFVRPRLSAGTGSITLTVRLYLRN